MIECGTVKRASRVSCACCRFTGVARLRFLLDTRSSTPGSQSSVRYDGAPAACTCRAAVPHHERRALFDHCQGRRPPGAGADQQRAVLLERRHRHDRQLQGWRIARVAGDLGTGGIGIHQEHSFGIGHRNATSWHQQLIEHPTVRIGQTDANRRQPVVVAQPDIDPWVARPVTVLT